MTEPTPEKVTYVLPELGELTLDDAFAIKMHTQVDILRPPTVAHGDAALLWWVSKDSDHPLVFKDLLKLPLDVVGDLIADSPEDDQDEPPAELPTIGEGEDDAPKASSSSPSVSSPSLDTGPPPPPASDDARSANWD